jgi:hypothetical protein
MLQRDTLQEDARRLLSAAGLVDCPSTRPNNLILYLWPMAIPFFAASLRMRGAIEVNAPSPRVSTQTADDEVEKLNTHSSEIVQLVSSLPDRLCEALRVRPFMTLSPMMARAASANMILRKAGQAQFRERLCCGITERVPSPAYILDGQSRS